MRIIVDFGHPAHVHYFKSFIKVMERSGSSLLCFARDRGPIHQLLDQEGIRFVNRGKGSNSILGKALYALKTIIIIVKESSGFHPQFLFSFGGAYIAFAGFVLCTHVIVLDDTETAVLNRLTGLLFTDIVITPDSFRRNLGRKQVRMPGSFDLAYLHPNAFTPNFNLIRSYVESDAYPFVLVRFVSWKSHHDIGRNGMSDCDKITFIKSISEKYKLYITSEEDLPNELAPYKLNLPPHLIHQFIYHASVVVGESGTMATEAAVLGTPSILFLNTAQYGVFDHYKKLGLLDVFMYSRQDYARAVEKIEFYITAINKDSRAERASAAIRSGIDVTAFLVNLVQNYSTSRRELLAGTYDWNKLCD